VARCGCDSEAFRTLIDDDVRISFRAHDGSVPGPRDAIAAIVVRSPDALRLILNSPGRLGLPELTRPVSSTSTALTASGISTDLADARRQRPH